MRFISKEEGKEQRNQNKSFSIQVSLSHNAKEVIFSHLSIAIFKKIEIERKERKERKKHLCLPLQSFREVLHQ